MTRTRHCLSQNEHSAAVESQVLIDAMIQCLKEQEETEIDNI